MIILYCVDNQWLDHDPFARFEMKKEEVHPTFLTKEEIRRIAEKEISIDRLGMYMSFVASQALHMLTWRN
jgi:hypothetical protein